MSKADQDGAFEKILLDHLTRVIDFLKFAEAKNAALLAFDSAWIVGITSLLSSERTLPPGFQDAAIAALGLFVLAALAATISLLPKLHARSPVGSATHGGPGLQFFGHVATLTAASFIAEAKKNYYPAKDAKTTTAFLNDLADQIVTNSKIARHKYRIFNMGAVASLAGVGAFAVPTAALLFRAFAATG